MSETYADPQPNEEEPVGGPNEPVESVAADDAGVQAEDTGQGTDEPDPQGVPNADTGVGIGADAEPNTFEPEEDPDATEPPD